MISVDVLEFDALKQQRDEYRNTIAQQAELLAAHKDEMQDWQRQMLAAQQQRDELLAALESVLLTREQEAKAQRAYEVANENYSDPKPESEAWGSAMIEASAAEKRAYAAIAKVSK